MPEEIHSREEIEETGAGQKSAPEAPTEPSLDDDTSLDDAVDTEFEGHLGASLDLPLGNLATNAQAVFEEAREREAPSSEVMKDVVGGVEKAIDVQADAIVRTAFLRHGEAILEGGVDASGGEIRGHATAGLRWDNTEFKFDANGQDGPTASVQRGNLSLTGTKSGIETGYHGEHVDVDLAYRPSKTPEGTVGIHARTGETFEIKFDGNEVGVTGVVIDTDETSGAGAAALDLRTGQLTGEVGLQHTGRLGGVFGVNVGGERTGNKKGGAVTVSYNLDLGT